MRLLFFVLLIVCTAGNNSFAQPAAFPQLVLSEYGKNLDKPALFSAYQVFIKKDSTMLVPQLSRLPLNYYSSHLGAACKMELQLEKQIKLPIRLRLGSKEQVDYLEGKFSRNR